MFSKKRIKKYIDHKGVCCPYCSSDNIESTSLTLTDDGQVVGCVYCYSCQKSWTEYYNLSNIEEIKDW